MKIGDRIEVRECQAIPVLVGGKAEVVDMQTQPYEKYGVYPIWGRMTTGEREGKTYGFLEEEVELLPEVKEVPEIGARVEVKAMKIGDRIRVRECQAIPVLAGGEAEVMDMQMQPYEEYRTYAIWARMTTGERQGKLYGFREDEVELLEKYAEPLPSARVEVKAKVLEELEEILKGVTTVEEVAEIEKVIGEVKGKLLLEPARGFWEGKAPCWEMFRCPEEVKNECPAFKYQSLPCWEIEGTYSKLYDNGTKGNNTDICQHCRVYKKWGQAKPVEIRLYGQGFDSSRLPAGES